MIDPSDGRLGHNSQSLSIQVEVRLFNSLVRFANGEGTHFTAELPAGTTIGELAARLAIPLNTIFVVLVNGNDVTPGLVGVGIRAGCQIEDGDVVAFSGPVPYSYGYGAPVV